MKLNMMVGKKEGRRARGPIWRRLRFPRPGKRTLVGLVAGILGIGVAVGWTLWETGTAQRLADQLKGKAIAVSADVGFQVQEIMVVGRVETTRKQLMKALKLVRGAPILAFDPHAAKHRIESLPWIRSARLERMLPNTVLLTVEERRPLALWQRKGRFSVVDHEGTVITNRNVGRFTELPIIVGKGAPVHAAELLATLATQPTLVGKVKAAVRVGGRRWNVRMKSGIDVRLPEKGAASAWSRLAEYQRTHKVLARDVRVLDLRLPDRLIVRTSGETKGKKKGKGQET
jgi:cell division protein FtsQ